ncbi:unnamed protein product, partial [Phaeothamnion confervicola]
AAAAAAAGVVAAAAWRSPTDPLELLNTTFALVPGGRRPSTRRLGEAMLAGCVPVVFADGWVPPLAELINWPAASLVFGSAQDTELLPALRAIPAVAVTAMRGAAVAAARRYLADDGARVAHTFEALAAHIGAALLPVR